MKSSKHVESGKVEVFPDPRVEIAMKDPSLRVRGAAVVALADHDEEPEAERLLREIAAGAEQPRELRVVAIQHLEDSESPELFGFLQDLALGDQDPSIAAVAVMTLGEFDDERSFAALRKVFAEAGDEKLQSVALEAIAERQDRAAVDFLSQVGGDESKPELARVAVWPKAVLLNWIQVLPGGNRLSLD